MLISFFWINSYIFSSTVFSSSSSHSSNIVFERFFLFKGLFLICYSDEGSSSSIFFTFKLLFLDLYFYSLFFYICVRDFLGMLCSEQGSSSFLLSSKVYSFMKLSLDFELERECSMDLWLKGSICFLGSMKKSSASSKRFLS